MLAGVEHDRPYELLSSRDAKDLYSRLHREPVVVIAFTTVWIRRDPSKDPAVLRHLVKLESFVRYKAEHVLVRSIADANRAIAAIPSLQSVVDCDGPRDPRVLPLHVFQTRRDWRGLGSQSERDQFAQTHGRAPNWEDGGGNPWPEANPSAYHSQEQLRVAGHTLARGFHWDAGVGRSRARYLTADEVWVLKHPSAYVNIFPDGYVRPPQGLRGIRRVFP